MIISLIAAASENNVIGKDNHLVWNLPNDMKFFKNTTWGMPVIMGRKTYDTFKGEPLPGRFNIVISRQRDFRAAKESVKVVNSLQEAINYADETDCKEYFVIGGGEIYKETLPIANRIYLTRVHAVLEGDAFFPEIDPAVWTLVSSQTFEPDEKHAYSYSFQRWERLPNSK